MRYLFIMHADISYTRVRDEKFIRFKYIRKCVRTPYNNLVFDFIFFVRRFNETLFEKLNKNQSSCAKKKTVLFCFVFFFFSLNYATGFLQNVFQRFLLKMK